MIKLIQSNDYKELKKFFIENELEVSDEDPVPTELVKFWKLIDESGGAQKLIGGIVLAKREGEFIIDGIAVDKGYRKQKLGKKMLDKAIEEVRAASGGSVYLVARAPGFFRTQGFVTTPKENAPNFFECLTCPQFEISCHPEVMKLTL